MPDASADYIVEIDGLGFSRGARRIFDNLSIRIRRGEVTAIMGPSGAGKTTLLRLITGQLVPEHGVIRVDGRLVNELSRRELYELRREIGMLFQHGALLTDYDVFENVAFPLREHTDLPERMIRHVVLAKLHAVGLRGAASMMPSELSGGMARRVALARAIVMDPKLLIYDEPFAGLDPISLGAVLRLIRDMNDALDITSIVVSHDVTQTATVVDRSHILSDGRVVASGSPQQLRMHESDFVQQFMHGLADGPVPFHYPAPDYAEHLLSRHDS
ncbi:ABC transporter ATP-binding protein [Candidatus Rariloculus sp.]|uniref:ABC transporter ATP-binding protein n=1 Tax=Candidatus Rariloculus sp. TaxID=3101265 RepID=UPI003D0E7831